MAQAHVWHALTLNALLQHKQSCDGHDHKHKPEHEVERKPKPTTSTHTSPSPSPGLTAAGTREACILVLGLWWNILVEHKTLAKHWPLNNTKQTNKQTSLVLMWLIHMQGAAPSAVSLSGRAFSDEVDAAMQQRRWPPSSAQAQRSGRPRFKLAVCDLWSCPVG